MIVSENEHIFLASFSSNRAEPSIFAMVLTENKDPTDYLKYHEFKINLPLPKAADFAAGSNKAVQFALNYINPYESTVIYHSLPFASDLDLSFYKELTLESIDREINPAWHALLLATRGIKPGTI